MPTSKTPTDKIQRRSPKVEVGSATYLPVVLEQEDSPSPTDLFEHPEFSRSWDNDTKYQVARNLLHLRRYRGKSQSEVAEAMGTSQSAVARIETGDENITFNTFERHIAALGGRFFVRIQPEEFPFIRPRPWWEAAASMTTGWTPSFVIYKRTGGTERAIVGMERVGTDSLIIANASTSGS